METRDFVSDLLTEISLIITVCGVSPRRVQRVRVILIVPGRICIVT